MQGQSDGRKQEVEAEAVGGGGGGVAGGGNLTFTPQTNPPVTKTYFSALLDSLLWPPGPPKTCCLQFPYSCWKEKNGLGGGEGDPEGTKRTQKCCFVGRKLGKE